MERLDHVKIPKIKICGLTSAKEVQWCLEEQINYAGMVVFFPKSKRNMEIWKAKELLAALHGEKIPGQEQIAAAGVPNQEQPLADRMKSAAKPVQAVAVTVSPTPEQVKEIQEAGFDQIQVHGELSKAAFDAIEIPMIRAFNGLDRELYEKFHNCHKVEAYLFDAKIPGSGETFDWDELQQIPRDEKPFFLAGGLNPDNIELAIRQVQPDVVDVSSGVEISPEIAGKDREKIKLFVHRVRGING